VKFLFYAFSPVVYNPVVSKYFTNFFVLKYPHYYLFYRQSIRRVSKLMSTHVLNYSSTCV